MNTLVGLYFSPWTERARWALDYHGIAYRYRDYTTLFDEPWLRFKTGKPFGRVSVPLLITPGANINDSFDIAVYADRHSGKAPLIPTAHYDEIRQWVDAAELALRAARIRATRRIQQSPATMAERLPAFIPGPLRKPLFPLSWVGSEYILYKYRLAAGSDEQLARDMDDFLGKVEQALGQRPFLFSEFSFADMVVATMLQAVTPVARRYIDLGSASERSMCEPELASRYAGLIAWRDELYQRYR